MQSKKCKTTVNVSFSPCRKSDLLCYVECSIAQAHRDGPRAKAEGYRRGRAAILKGGKLTPSRAPYAERTRNPLAQQQRVRGAKAPRLRDRRRVSTNARAVGLEQVFAPQVDAGDEHPAYDAHDHAVGHHPACDAKAHTAGVCHPGCGQAGVVVGDPACQAKGAETLLQGVETLLPVQFFSQ